VSAAPAPHDPPVTPIRFGVITFPGSCDDLDARLACGRVGTAVRLWHADRDLAGVDAVVIPGGFSYGDYLRPGAIARFAPIMDEVIAFAQAGGLVMGICNGFQVLCEAGLLPGALLPNTGRRFLCRQVTLDVARPDTPFTTDCPDAKPLSIPVKHTTGRYHVPPETLAQLVSRDQIVLRYAAGANPNGSVADIAGVVNQAGNVFGLMPHPEHAVDRLTGSTDGLHLFASMRDALARATA
jgi:phosphoribosylformylglycinamidine synthase I